ncbi:MAG: Gfo/Idh/MocA family oxidoreductase [Thermoguttaceae bacterium]
MIRVGIAGIGFMGMTHYRAYQRIRGVKVAALCEQDPKRLAGDWRSIKGNFGAQGEMMDLGGIRRYAELDEMIADPDLDLIDICLPPAAHPSTTIAALKAGKHVFCEKPIALNPADAVRMVDTAKKAGRLLMIGHVLPFFPEYHFAYQAITSGKYGKLLGGHFKRIISDPLWLPDFYDPKKVGGPMLDLHVHDAHFIRLMFGMPKAVQSVGTMRGQVVERFTTQFLYDPPRMVTAASGVIGQQGRPFTHAYEIYLEKATLLFDYAALAKVGDSLTPVTVLTADGKVARPKLPGGDPTVPFVNELTEAVRAVRANQPSALLAGDLARDAVILCQKETESVVKGRAVKI